jgi:hypothetical protein
MNQDAPLWMGHSKAFPKQYEFEGQGRFSTDSRIISVTALGGTIGG